MTKTKNTDSTFRINRNYILVLVIFAVAIYVLLPQVSSFKGSLKYLQSPDYVFVLIAAVFAFLTYVSGSINYLLLAFSKLRLSVTLLIQLAAMFVNRILPSGLGAVGINFLYLRQKKHTEAQAFTVVGINNFLGLLGHTTVILAVIVYSSLANQKLIFENSINGRIFVVVLVVLGLIVGIATVIFGANRVKKAINDLKSQILSYRYRKKSLFLALLSSISLTLFNALSLYFCLLALGVHLSFAQVFIVFGIGVGAGAAVPTPGGIGGFEAGLVAGFVAYDVNSSQALAAALLYRIITYWIPLLFGGIAFVASQKQLIRTPRAN